MLSDFHFVNKWSETAARLCCKGSIFPERRWFHLSSLFLISLECAAQSSNCMHAPLRASKYKCSQRPTYIHSIHNKQVLSLFIQFAFSKALRSAVAAAWQHIHMQLSAMHAHWSDSYGKEETGKCACSSLHRNEDNCILHTLLQLKFLVDHIPEVLFSW
jgi:hypothetical protein